MQHQTPAVARHARRGLDEQGLDLVETLFRDLTHVSLPGVHVSATVRAGVI
jgi:hypothetical protein